VYAQVTGMERGQQERAVKPFLHGLAAKDALYVADT